MQDLKSRFLPRVVKELMGVPLDFSCELLTGDLLRQARQKGLGEP